MSTKQITEILQRNLAGDGDFSDLMSRSTEYADAASIQSLFSPVSKKVLAYFTSRHRGDLIELVVQISGSQNSMSVIFTRPLLRIPQPSRIRQLALPVGCPQLDGDERESVGRIHVPDHGSDTRLF